MIHGQRERRLYRVMGISGAGIVLFLSAVGLISAALNNWNFTGTTDYVFDAAKIEVGNGSAKLKLVPGISLHDKEADFTGTHGDTQWLGGNIQLNGAGLSSGKGSYISQAIDSGADATLWGRVSWHETLTQGTASFAAAKNVGVMAVSKSLYGADIDGDDDIDVVAVQDSEPYVLYFENDGAENFTPRVISTEPLNNVRDVRVADVNQDGRPDVVVLASNAVQWFENKGGMPASWTRWSVDKPSAGSKIELADVDGDGRLDIVVGDGSSVRWYQNDGADPVRWTLRPVDNTLAAVDALSAGDLDADGDLDLLAADERGLYWYENDGKPQAFFTKRTVDIKPSSMAALRIADVNSDGKMDVVGVERDPNTLAWYQNGGSTPPVFTRRVVDSGPLALWVSVAAGDLDRDGDPDLIAVNDAEIHWYQNNGGALPVWTKVNLTAGAGGGVQELFLVNLQEDVQGDDDLDILLSQGTRISWIENRLPHSNIRLQLRTSVDGASWTDWVGPGGRTTSSYTNPDGATVTVPDGRYIQYRVLLRAHQSDSLNAALSSVRLDPANSAYAVDGPAVQNKTGEEFSSITSFAETLGAGNQGMVRYQISNDGSTWYYHNGSVWVRATAGLAHANSAAVVNSSIATFARNVGPGKFYFKALLVSDGIQQVELDNVEIQLGTSPLAASGSGAVGEVSPVDTPNIVATLTGQSPVVEDKQEPEEKTAQSKPSGPHMDFTINGDSGPLEIFAGSSLVLSWAGSGLDAGDPTPCAASVKNLTPAVHQWSGQLGASGQKVILSSGGGPETFMITCKTASGDILLEQVQVVERYGLGGHATNFQVFALANGANEDELKIRNGQFVQLSWNVSGEMQPVSCNISDQQHQVLAWNLDAMGSWRVPTPVAGSTYYVNCVDGQGVYDYDAVRLVSR